MTVIDMVRLQRLEDLATRCGTKPARTLPAKRRPGRRTNRRGDHRWRRSRAIAAEAHDASQSQPAVRLQVPISSFRAAA